MTERLFRSSRIGISEWCVHRRLKIKEKKLSFSNNAFDSIGKYKTFIILPLLLTIFVAFLFLDLRPVYAHTPHDVIDALELSPAYVQDKTLFVVMSGHLRRSTDGGSSWKELINGLDNAHGLSSIAISSSFQADKTLFVSSCGDGIYRSRDAGDSWVKVNNGLGTRDIKLLSLHRLRDDEILLAAGAEEGLFKTSDGGDSWHQVMNNVKVTAVAFSPESKSSFIFAGDQTGRLFFSADGGKTWQQKFQFSDSGAITSVVIPYDFFSNDTFYVGTERNGIFKTRDDGVSFIEINSGISAKSKNIRSLVLSPNYEADSTIFASTWYEAAFCSKNRGDTWEKYDKGITWDPQADTKKYWSPHFRDLKISKGFSKDKTIFLGGFDGLFKSTDGGLTWFQMETLPVKLIMGLATSPKSKDGSSIAITTYGGGAYILRDQGLGWSICNLGLSRTRLSDIVFSPNYSSDNKIFSAQRGYLLRSTNQGKTWDKIPVVKKKKWRLILYGILKKLNAPDSFTKRILSNHGKGNPFPTVIAVSPNFDSDGTLFFGTRKNGIFRSVNGGLSNSLVWDGMWRTTVSLVVSPDFQSDRTVFASIRGVGVYKTINGGNTWQSINQGFSFVNKWNKSEIVTGHNRDIILAISPNYKIDKTIFAASPKGLYQSTNGGDSWQYMKGAAYGGDSFIISVAISPNYENDQTLIVSVNGKGLFKSENGGTTFVQIAPDLMANNHRIERIKFSGSYASDSSIYAASYEQLFQSKNGGNTWRVLQRPVRYENHREVVLYDGEWKKDRGEGYSASSITHSNTSGDTARLNFAGTGIIWIGTISNEQGIARVYIDDKYIEDVDLFSESPHFLVKPFSVSDLPFGAHSVKIEVTNRKNPKSKGYRVAIDAFDILP